MKAPVTSRPTEIEGIAAGLDLATAMAVSGAAASSNMGAQSIKALTPTLAILNIRLGYWVRKPACGWPMRASPGPYSTNSISCWNCFGLTAGRMPKTVYLTDGGHIENLGIYELLSDDAG